MLLEILNVGGAMSFFQSSRQIVYRRTRAGRFLDLKVERRCSLPKDKFESKVGMHSEKDNAIMEAGLG